MTGAYVGSVLGQEVRIEAIDVHLDLLAEPRHAHDTGAWLDPLEDVLGLDPVADDAEVAFGSLADSGQDPRPCLEDPRRHLLVDRRAADQDLLLGGQQHLGKRGVASGDPADAKAREAERLRHRRNAERALRQRRRHRQGIRVGELPVRLVHQQPGPAVGLDERHHALELLPLDHRPGGVVRIRETDQAGIRAKQACEAINVERPALLEAQVQQVHLRAKRPRRLQVGRVVGRGDHGVPALAQQRGRDHEERRGCAGGDQHVIRAQTLAVGGDLLAKARQATVVAVLEQQARDIAVELVVAQAHVPERALGEVVRDRVVAQLLGRLDLDRHPPVTHPSQSTHVPRVGSDPFCAICTRPRRACPRASREGSDP